MQTNIFDFMMNEVSVNKPLRLIELFGGYGSQAMALKRIGAKYEHWKLSEWQVNADKSYNVLHNTKDFKDYSKGKSREYLVRKLYKKGISSDGSVPLSYKQISKMKYEKLAEIYNSFCQNQNLGSIVNISGKQLNIVDTDKYTYLMTYSFPCFTKDTLILTNNGLKSINEVNENDYVLTHNKRYKKVIASKKTGLKLIWKIKGFGIDEIKCTGNHPFYVRKCVDKKKKVFENPEWIKCRDLTENHYLGIAINQESKMPEWNGIDIPWLVGGRKTHRNEISKIITNKEFWWIVGRYLKDGWLRTGGGVVILCSKEDTNDIIEHLNKCNMYFCIIKEKDRDKIHIPLKELSEFLKEYGESTNNKRLPGYIYDMPIEYLKFMIKGYGINEKCSSHCITDTNKDFVYGMAQIIAKVYETPYNITFHEKKSRCLIKKDVYNEEDLYCLLWKEEKGKQDDAFYEKGYIWFPINSIENTKQVENVYDIETEDDHSFMANGVIAHNCTDLSLAGKQRGMEKGSGTRSSMLWEVERLLNELRDSNSELPQILFMENVPQVINDKNIGNFHKWLDFLSSLGYTNHFQLLNARDFGIAQNRERCFMLSFLGEHNYHFPEPVILKKRLRDYLEKDVDEKYYITNDKAKKLIDELIKSKSIDVNEIVTYDIPQKVRKRVYDIDKNKLGDFLRLAKMEIKKTNFAIAKELNMPITQVEHYFRKDSSFSIPDDSIWPALKKVLKITSDEWDKAIMTFKEVESVYEKSNRVYDSNGIAPTITSASADEKIVEPKCLNSKGGRNGIEGLQPSIQDRVYDTDEIATAITTSFMPSYLVKEEKKGEVIGTIYCENSEKFGTSLMPLAHTLKASKCDVAVVEKLDNPGIEVLGNYSKSDHDATRIVSPNGLAPTVRENHGSVTAVAIEETPDIDTLGLLDIGGNEQVRRVYGVNGIAPTLNTMQGGNRQPKIVEKQEVTPAAIRGRYSDNGEIVQHIEEGNPEYSNAITTVVKDNVLIEKDNVHDRMERLGQISVEGSQCGFVYSDEGLFPTLSAGCHGYANPHVYTRYRIRKLTPVECGRLMDVDMEDIIKMIISDHKKAEKFLTYMHKNDIVYEGKKEMDKLKKIQGMSNSALYQQYGNSIVVSVMCAMFRNLNIEGVDDWSTYCKKNNLEYSYK